MAVNIQKQTWPCRVCGYDMGFDVWGGDDNLNFTYDICECCGAEAGTDDFDLGAVRRYRQRWKEGGFRWFSPSQKPVNWDIEAQSKLIPERWR